MGYLKKKKKSVNYSVGSLEQKNGMRKEKRKIENGDGKF